jgi:hypothetical protein
MPTARYKFVRDTSMEGFLSRNRASTDALGAMTLWSSGAAGRSYDVRVDEDDILVVDLTWIETDRTAGADLEQSSRSAGVWIAMPIWKLTPLLTDSSDWKLSTYRGEVIARAKDEEEARELAMVRFAIAADGKLGQNTPASPWVNPALVSCQAIQTHDYQDTGPAAVLSPRSAAGDASPSVSS